MRKSMKLLALSMLALVLVLSGCNFSDSSNGNSDSKDGSKDEKKTLKLSLENDIPDLNQVKTTDGISFGILNNIMEGLYRLDENHEAVPAMAESVEISEDKLTYTFKLREGVKWSNGDPVTAADFRYSWLRAIHPDTAGSYAFIIADYVKGAAEFVEGVATDSEVGIVAEDDTTLVVTLNEPTPYFLGLTAFVTYFPLNEKFVTEAGDDFALTTENILFNGPFTMTEYDQAAGVKLVKNDKYWDKENVGIDEVSLKVIKENSTALNLYEAGDLDRVYLSSSDIQSYQDDKEFGTESKFNSWFVQFNLTKAPFDNVNIRKAFQLGYDPEILTAQILNNGSTPASGVVASGMAGVDGKLFRELNPDLVTPNVEKAKEYLAAGLKEIGGTLPAIEILTADDTIAKDTATFLQSEFKKNLGVDVNISTKPYSGRLQAMRDDAYQMGINKWGADYNDASTYMDLWVGTPASPLRGHYSSTVYNDLVAKSKSETDEVKRMDYLLEAEKALVVDDAVIAPLYDEGKAFLQNAEVTNFTIHPYGAPLELKYIKKK
ncbi:peptide ABC transporter substrate-binding protein [Paenisporosarcina indica]|uniref:peptide ABC transporter substrate-binding protein n=1 Tax=Paenisporosarcina indica TaxID=650093 RepID=UPI00094FBC33|nr:peptide ABC transporter substrate-binding protein [Paenisporosarcina indica]